MLGKQRNADFICQGAGHCARTCGHHCDEDAPSPELGEGEARNQLMAMQQSYNLRAGSAGGWGVQRRAPGGGGAGVTSGRLNRQEAGRKECEERGSQHPEGKAMGHGGSQSLWVASMILWLGELLMDARQGSTGPDLPLGRLTSTETKILSHPHSQARNKNTFWNAMTFIVVRKHFIVRTDIHSN